LINEPKGGHARVELDAAPTSRSYETATNVLTTSFEGALGRATLTDFMPIFALTSLPDEESDGDPQNAVVRILPCTQGTAAGRFVLRFAPDLPQSCVNVAGSSEPATEHPYGLYQQLRRRLCELIPWAREPGGATEVGVWNLGVQFALGGRILLGRN
jgi:hypothetical protein